MSRDRSFKHDIELGITPPTNTWEELKEFAQRGVEFGAHTKSHCNIGAITDPAELRNELLGSIEAVEAELECRCRYFAFPFGRPENMSQAAATMLSQRGMQGFCSAYGALNWPGQNGFHIRRIHGDPGLERLKNWLTLDARHLSDTNQLPFAEDVDYSNSTRLTTNS
ncbi:MAG: polysaccharide deacetylase family protein [Pirellulales bacterium]